MKLSAVQARLLKRFDSQLSPHGLSFSEYLVLNQLAVAPNGAMRRIDLADGIGLTASAVTRMLTPMEKTGLVKKEVNARDARVSLVKLTKAGKRMHSDTTTTLLYGADAIAQKLTANNRRSLTEVLAALG